MTTVDRILFIDDDPAVRTAFKRSLRNHGFTIDVASGAQQARELVAQHAYAVIATDHRMPMVNGLELVHEIQALQPDATYILVSGECDLDLAREAVNEHGISYVICKPWNTEELSSVLKRSLEAAWERRDQRALQQSMVQASRHLDRQRALLQRALDDAQTHLSETLLAALQMRGHETEGHCRRVAAYALRIAEEMGLKGRVLSSIERGAMLHDVGKIAIPDAILLKEGNLTSEERHVMRTHPQAGAQLLEGFEGLAGARQIVLQHHERWDGTGYPARLAGEHICLGARIFAVADTLDALLSDRPYRKRQDVEIAAEEIKRCSGTHFDPAVVEAFQRVPPAYWLEIQRQFPEPVRDTASEELESELSAAIASMIGGDRKMAA